METSRIEELKISYEELKKDAQRDTKKGTAVHDGLGYYLVTDIRYSIPEYRHGKA